jgi:hypothetical protein
MTRTPIIPLAILALLLPGCMTVASFGATAWAGVQTISRMVRVIEFVLPDKEKLMSIICSCGYPMFECPVHGPWCSRDRHSVACPQCYDDQAHRDAASEIVVPDKEEAEEDEDTWEDTHNIPESP